MQTAEPKSRKQKVDEVVYGVVAVAAGILILAGAVLA